MANHMKKIKEMSIIITMRYFISCMWWERFKD
jgi:hypothetical protein